jgi:catalase
MDEPDPPSAPPPLSAASTLLRLSAIGVIALGAAAAFAYTGGWLSPDRLTPDRMVAALANRGGDPVGHRRNHAKGLCFTGTFAANGAGARLSSAPMLATGSYPVIGRFAIAVGNPATPDPAGRVKSMAVRIVAPGGAEWRSGMNAMPMFAVATPQAFFEATQAQELDPATGKPNPALGAAFAKNHPESAAFADWAKSAPWTPSWADQAYNSLNAFRFIAADGTEHVVRWSMQPTIPPDNQPQSALAGLGADFLTRDLTDRLGKSPLKWTLRVTLAAGGDPSNDATKVWPADRETVDVGTLTIDRAEAEADGPCRDINYDPTILPVGIAVSDDPLLAARAAAYAKSFDLRTAEAAHYPAKGSTP